MASREYSKRLGVISDDQLQAALDRFDLGRLVSAKPIANGLFGQNLMVTASTGDYVFRGAPHWNPAGEDDWQFQKERFFSRIVHESLSGPPVAWPCLLEEGREIFGWGFAFQPRLPGSCLQQPAGQHYTNKEMREQADELGRALAALHTVELPTPGHHNPRTDRIAPSARSYGEYVEEEIIETLLEMSLRASSATTANDVEWARSVVAQGRTAMNLPFQPVVVHMDFGAHNVLFEQRDGIWRLTGVIDWATAESGHPEGDLIRPLMFYWKDRVAGRKEFLAAYRDSHPELPGFRQRFPVFVLWERLLLWEYWQRNKGFKEGLGMREWMEPFVTMLA